MITITIQNLVVKIAERSACGVSLPEISSGFDREMGKISRISSTSPQPYVGANYKDGAFVGGKTLTAIEVQNLIKISAEKGAQIEGGI